MKTEYIRIKSRLAGYFIQYAKDLEIDLSYTEDPSGEIHILHWGNQPYVDIVLAAMKKDGIE